MDKRFKGTDEEYLEFRKRCNEANKKYYSKPEVRKKKRIYCKKYRVENKEKISEYGKIHNKLPEVKERIKKWREENKKHLKEYSRSPKRKLSKRISNKKWREKNKDKLIKLRLTPEFREKRKKIYENSKEHLKQVRKDYYKTERGILSYQRANHIKLAIRKNRPTDLTREKIKEIFERDKVCVYCGSDKKLELDHIIPLVKGGSCMSNNFVLACAKCNRSKHGRDVFFWCKLQEIEVPKIVLELLKEQKLN